MKILVTGRAGSGKSAVNSELQRRGYNSHDSDDFPGLASWVDVVTKEPVLVDPSQYVDYSQVDWDWDGEVLKKILAANPELFLCGSASNDLDFFNIFDRVFVLSINPRRQLEFLRTRDSAYGKDPRQQQEIIQEQTEFVKAAQKLGATAIENDKPIDQLVNGILEITHV